VPFFYFISSIGFSRIQWTIWNAQFGYEEIEYSGIFVLIVYSTKNFGGIPSLKDP